MNSVVKLISGTDYEIDDNGNQKPVTAPREVYAKNKSIHASEFYNAGKVGLKPSYVMEIWFFDYQNETEIIINDKPYQIYRTYQKGERIELYCCKKVGSVIEVQNDE